MEINENRLAENFIKLTSFDSESFHEKEIAGYLKQQLVDLGLEVTVEGTDESYLEKHPESFPNIHGVLKGNVKGEPILLSAHLDTVAPGNQKKAIVGADGVIKSDGSTVLGADDISGIVSILEALSVIKENNLRHPDIEVLFTVAEEPFCEGSRHYDFSCIRAKKAYVLDLVGAVGTAAVAAPSIISFEISVKGRAAHAGFAPEEGINALNIAVAALAERKTGHVWDDTTVNFGIISGGTGKNIVPAEIKIQGEIRSLQHERAILEAEAIFESFRINARKAGGLADCQMHEHIRAYDRKESDEVVKHFKIAAKAAGIHETKLITTFGGSDGNRLNEQGIETIVLACAMENVHTTEEYTKTDELVKSARLALKLMTTLEE